jgi:hypothetical protein
VDDVSQHAIETKTTFSAPDIYRRSIIMLMRIVHRLTTAGGLHAVAAQRMQITQWG